MACWFRIKYFYIHFCYDLFNSSRNIVFKTLSKIKNFNFFNPERDPLGAGYQIIQSKIAVGSGGIFGKGFLQGSQSYLDYLPEKHTDFIFTLFSEEFGFSGSLVLLLIYVLIISRIVSIGNEARNNFAKLYCFTVLLLLFLFMLQLICLWYLVYYL